MATVTERKNSKFYSITTKTTVPAFETKTGTIATVGIQVLGTGTLFLSEIKKGDWIVDITTNNEIRQVVKSFDNLTAEIDSPFTADIPAGFALRVVRSRTKQMAISNAGGANGTIDGTAVVPGESINWGKSDKNPNGSDHIDPVIANATGTIFDIEILK